MTRPESLRDLHAYPPPTEASGKSIGIARNDVEGACGNKGVLTANRAPVNKPRSVPTAIVAVREERPRTFPFAARHVSCC